MDSKTAPPTIPVIDFSGVEKPGTPEWAAVKAAVREAVEGYGCFEAKYDKIPIELRRSLFGAIEELFELPLQTKLKNLSPTPYHGYVGQYPMIPLYESMGIEEANVPYSIESFSSLLWPEGHPDFRKTVESYSEKLAELDQTIRRMVVESLGLEKYMDEHLDSGNYLLRFMKYQGPKAKETKVGLTAHTDQTFVSLLHQNQVAGLEVLTKDGHWIAVKPSQDSFIAMIGDDFNAWTNGRLYSAYHRVMMSGEEARYSVGMFSIAKAGYIIKAPEEMVDEEHPVLFKPYDHYEFLRFYYTAEGQRAVSPLKAYCGA